MTTTAQADLKATLEASLFSDSLERRMKDAKTVKALEDEARGLNSTMFFALPDWRQQELAFEYSLRHYTLAGAGVL